MLDFKTTSYEKADGGYAILLAGKPLKTPKGGAMIAPTEKLAITIAGEWQKLSSKIDWSKLPMSRQLNAALDNMHSVAKWQDELVEFLKNDLLLYFASSPKELKERQENGWLPLLEKFNSEFGVELKTTTGISPIKQSEKDISNVSEFSVNLGYFDTFIMRNFSGFLGSFILAYATHSGWIDAKTAYELSTIDEAWQEEHWGQDAQEAKRREKILQEFNEGFEFYNLMK